MDVETNQIVVAGCGSGGKMPKGLGLLANPRAGPVFSPERKKEKERKKKSIPRGNLQDKMTVVIVYEGTAMSVSAAAEGYFFLSAAAAITAFDEEGFRIPVGDECKAGGVKKK